MCPLGLTGGSNISIVAYCLLYILHCLFKAHVSAYRQHMAQDLLLYYFFSLAGKAIPVLTATLYSSHVFQSYMFSGQEEERSVFLGIGSLKFVTESEPPRLLQLQPAHRLPQGATICTNHTQSRTYREAERREGDRDFIYDVGNKMTLKYNYYHQQMRSGFPVSVFARVSQH